MNSGEGSGSSIGTPAPGPKVSTVLCRKSVRPASTSWRPSASSSMWAAGTAPFRSASSMMAARISGGIFRPGSATSLTHILMKWTPSSIWPRTSARASSSVVGAFRPAALNPPGYENPVPAV